VNRPRTLPWQLSFASLGVIWGCSFLFIKLGLQSFSPIQVGFLRLTIGAATLLLLSRAMGVGLLRRPGALRHLAVTGLLYCSLPGVLFAFGETHVSSAVAGIINGATPLMVLLVVLVAFPEEHPTRQRVAGLLVGFAGVLVVLGIWDGFAGGELIGVLACLGGITCYGIAFPYTRRHLVGTGDHPVAIATGQVGMGALFLLPVMLLELAAGGGRVATPIPADTLLGIVALGSLGSGVAYALNAQIIKAAGSTVASSVGYLSPLVAVAVGIAILGEPIAWYEPVGALIVLTGVAIAQGRLRIPGLAPAPAA